MVSTAATGADDVEATVRAILTLADRGPATLGSGRLVCIDGPSGSGKTTLAGALARSRNCPVVHMDDLYEGWSGLRAGVDDHVLGILGPLSGDEPGHYRRWDWNADARGELHRVDPAPLLVLEGVGAGNRAWAELTSVLAWVATDPGTALARGRERDAADVVGDWERLWEEWATDEAELFAREGTRARANLTMLT